MLAALLLAATVPLPIQYVAKTADVIAIGEVHAAKPGSGHIGELAVTRQLKGEPVETAALYASSDVPSVSRGDTLLVFLTREQDGYAIMRKLVVTPDGKSVERPQHLVMSTLCLASRCPLAEVLVELKPWLKRNEPTAFITSDGTLSNRPSRELKCKPVGEATLECGKEGDAPDVDLLCFEKKSGTVCLRK